MYKDTNREFNYDGHIINLDFVKRKGTDLNQSYDKSPYTDRKIQKAT